MYLNTFSVCCVITLTLLTGCGSAQAPAAEHAGAAYELVLTEKPDVFDSFVKSFRAGYDACVYSAQLAHLPIKPFPQLPASLGTTRITYVIRGRDRVVRRESLNALDISKDTPDQQCEVDVDSNHGMNVDLVVGNTHTTVGTDENGHRTVHTEDVSDLRSMDSSSRAQSTAKYTESRTVNGVELRCLPAGKPPLDANDFQELCVYAHEDVLVEPDGKAITLASRVRPLPGTPYIMVVEPQSLRTLDHADAGPFDAATYSR